MSLINRRLLLGAWLLAVLSSLALTPAQAEVRAASSIPVASVVQPADLAAELKNPALPKPVLLHVGFRQLYAQAHIPGSDYAGPGGDDDGLKALSERVAKLSKDAPIVIYCGCCPWDRCPNVAAAYERLRNMGFTQVRVLYLAENFGADWADKGYPTVTSP
jgi:rhodanese-related sulfurtransferase